MRDILALAASNSVRILLSQVHSYMSEGLSQILGYIQVRLQDKPERHQE